MLLTLRIVGVEGHPRVYMCTHIHDDRLYIPKRSMCDIILSSSLRARQIQLLKNLCISSYPAHTLLRHFYKTIFHILHTINKTDP